MVSGGKPAELSINNYISDGAIAMLLVASITLMVFHLKLDPVQFAIPSTIIVLIALTLSTIGGGGSAAFVTAMSLLATDFFLIDPTYDLGIASWRGVFYLMIAGLAVALFSIMIIRAIRRGRLARRQPSELRCG
jgi:K+-sensing histidine kinase KdpD